MLLSAVLSPKAGQLRQARSPGGTLTWGFKQSYGVCCLTGHVFRGVQWSDVNTKKRTSRNIISNLGAINPTYLLPPPPTPSSIEFDFLLLVSLYLANVHLLTYLNIDPVTTRSFLTSNSQLIYLPKTVRVCHALIH